MFNQKVSAISAVLILAYGLLNMTTIWLTRTALYPSERRQHYDAEVFPAEEVSFKTANGEQVLGLFQSADPETVILFCHGNGGSLALFGPVLQALEESGFSYLIFDYPGYGKSSGIPTEQGLYDSGQAAYDFLLTKGFEADQIVVEGQSLGSAVALYVGAHNEVRSVLIEAPFHRLTDFVAPPVKPLLEWLVVSVPYRNDLTIKQVEEPLLIVHGTADEIIPLTHSQALLSKATKGELLILQGQTHNQGYQASLENLEKIRHFVIHSELPKS